MTETLANGYSSESTQPELPNEYQHDRVKMVAKNICVLVVCDESSLSIRVVEIIFVQHLLTITVLSILVQNQTGFAAITPEAALSVETVSVAATVIDRTLIDI